MLLAWLVCALHPVPAPIGLDPISSSLVSAPSNDSSHLGWSSEFPNWTSQDHRSDGSDGGGGDGDAPSFQLPPPPSHWGLVQSGMSVRMDSALLQLALLVEASKNTVWSTPYPVLFLSNLAAPNRWIRLFATYGQLVARFHPAVTPTTSPHTLVANVGASATTPPPLTSSMPTSIPTVSPTPAPTSSPTAPPQRAARFHSAAKPTTSPHTLVANVGAPATTPPPLTSSLPTSIPTVSPTPAPTSSPTAPPQRTKSGVGTNKVKCSKLCGRGFSTLSGMKRHRFTCTGPTANEPSVSCGESSSTAQQTAQRESTELNVQHLLVDGLTKLRVFRHVSDAAITDFKALVFGVVGHVRHRLQGLLSHGNPVSGLHELLDPVISALNSVRSTHLENSVLRADLPIVEPVERVLGWTPLVPFSLR